MKSSKNNLIFVPVLYLIMWVMKAPKSFGKIAILKIWELVSLGDAKTHWVPKIHFMWNPLLTIPPKSWHNYSFLGSVRCTIVNRCCGNEILSLLERPQEETTNWLQEEQNMTFLVVQTVLCTLQKQLQQHGINTIINQVMPSPLSHSFTGLCTLVFLISVL